ncbi:MAG TPA: phage tail sheath C-terminal domain-containing protein [Thermoanaerobaculia bacterium]|nr:phage tail sheath C-terminal domain-containing protein [Thermoanaerobaculia bacterium]
MPVPLTYPGVYIEEIPSGVRTILGVPTSITAFIGRAIRGPVNTPVTINNYGDFERTFGGLWVGSALGFSVQDFFLNGGAQAVIVRVFGGPPATAGIDAKGLKLQAATPGAWANGLRARIDFPDASVAGQVAAALGVTTADLFNLTVHDNGTGQTEVIQNVTVTESPRRVDRVLETTSLLVRALQPLPSARPAAHAAADANVWTTDTQSSPVNAPGTDGAALTAADFVGGFDAQNNPVGASRAAKTGLYALENADLFNLLVIPPYLLAPPRQLPVDIDYLALLPTLTAYCEERRAMLIVDSPSAWTSTTAVLDPTSPPPLHGVASLSLTSKNAALYFPRIGRVNPLHQNRVEDFAPSGAIAGVFSRIDSSRGVWKAPAGLEATLNGVVNLTVPLTDPENGQLNPLGVNCLRVRPAAGPVIWGARTRQGDDRLASEWKYVPVRRLALYLEESLYRGTQWVVFEPNDEPLWAQIRLNVGAFLQNLFRQGAFQGSTPQQAYFVKVDRETTTQNDIDRGIVNIVVGFAPLKPAEFVVIQIQQIAGQIQT